ncbi:MAG TPA: DUF6438 domain-containing protein [Thermoanaerobaculia bacterium]
MRRSIPLLVATAALAGSLAAPLVGAPAAAGGTKSAVRIVLDRSVCYGDCPVYRVEIDGDGAVTYVGRAYVKVIGTRRATVPRSEVDALLAQFHAAKFFDLKDEYRAPVTDFPTYTVTLEEGGRKKTVVDYAAAAFPKYVTMPAVVTELEKAIDRVAKTSRWTGVK